MARLPRNCPELGTVATVGSDLAFEDPLPRGTPVARFPEAGQFGVRTFATVDQIENAGLDAICRQCLAREGVSAV